MEKKYYFIIGIIVIIAGIIFISVYLKEGLKEDAITEIPLVYLEATVLSLDNDLATLKINSISSEHKIIDCNIMGEIYPAPKEGGEITFPFYYGTGPAIIRTIPLDRPQTPSNEIGINDTEVRAPLTTKVQKQEGDYLVTIIESSAIDEIQEEILPGLEIGSKIKTTIPNTCTPDIIIYKYELIS